MRIGEWHTQKDGWRHLKHEAEFMGDYCIRPSHYADGFCIPIHRRNDDKFLLVDLTREEVDNLFLSLSNCKKRRNEGNKK